MSAVDEVVTEALAVEAVPVRTTMFGLGTSSGRDEIRSGGLIVSRAVAAENLAETLPSIALESNKSSVKKPD